MAVSGISTLQVRNRTRRLPFAADTRRADARSAPADAATGHGGSPSGLWILSLSFLVTDANFLRRFCADSAPIFIAMFSPSCSALGYDSTQRALQKTGEHTCSFRDQYILA